MEITLTYHCNHSNANLSSHRWARAMSRLWCQVQWIAFGTTRVDGVGNDVWGSIMLIRLQGNVVTGFHLDESINSNHQYPRDSSIFKVWLNQKKDKAVELGEGCFVCHTRRAFRADWNVIARNVFIVHEDAAYGMNGPTPSTTNSSSTHRNSTVLVVKHTAKKVHNAKSSLRIEHLRDCPVQMQSVSRATMNSRFSSYAIECEWWDSHKNLILWV